MEDIRGKTGWSPPQYSKKAEDDIPVITPAELLAYLDKYHRDTIKMKVKFYAISTRGLNKVFYENRAAHRWSSMRFIEFGIKDPQQQAEWWEIMLFIKKDNPDVEKLLKLTEDDEFTITGKVRNTKYGQAWIEVLKIDL